MDPEVAKTIISKAGGPTKLAERLGIVGAYARQRVNQWRYRGIPPRVWLDNQKLFERLKREAEKA